jgi:excisionase family DNA binding protein
VTTTLDAETTRPDRAYRIRQVAEILNTSERQIWRFIADRRLRADKLGPRCVRIFDSELARFLASIRAE